ncbi:hypothetical protein BpHYR1_000091 [Brachionus plicatilis]|uniref:Uncharacterized protein n=1 Tax=Brachionus plicatilis TaxID=10195 RepID=A0A3M7PNA7_BRAPC|nr:hypothetical protein BpHYR1_000091 [Brachionus plicatilis]
MRRSDNTFICFKSRTTTWKILEIKNIITFYSTVNKYAIFFSHMIHLSISYNYSNISKHEGLSSIPTCLESNQPKIPLSNTDQVASRISIKPLAQKTRKSRSPKALNFGNSDARKLGNNKPFYLCTSDVLGLNPYL